MNFARFTRDASSASKDKIRLKTEEYGCQDLVKGKKGKNGKVVFTKDSYLRALTMHFVKQDFPRGIPKPIRDSIVFPPALCSLWNSKDPIWDTPYVFEPLLTGFRVIISISEVGVFAFSRFVSDEKYRRPQVMLPERIQKDLAHRFPKGAVLDAMYTADGEELAWAINQLGYSADPSGALDIALAMGSTTRSVIDNSESFKVHVLDIIEDEGQELLMSLNQRKRYLDRVFEKAPNVGVWPVEWLMSVFPYELVSFYFDCIEYTDGCAVKDAEAFYKPGGRDWIKLKNEVIYGPNATLNVVVREGVGYVYNPCEGEVPIVSGIGFGGRGEAVLRGGIPAVVTPRKGKSGGHLCLWKEGEGPSGEPQEIDQSTVETMLNFSSKGVSIENLLG